MDHGADDENPIQEESDIAKVEMSSDGGIFIHLNGGKDVVGIQSQVFRERFGGDVDRAVAAARVAARNALKE
jgi:hypothetical protein